ncbi:MAG: hypothetical protein HRU46_20125 [Verrucomicrobiales bacterium]|nr:hypothetical protein [Verrucomicrobiales bacterium]
MKKTQVAFQMSTERLAERGKLYFWTFTFAEKLDIKETRRRWNYLLTLMRRRWPNLCGLRVYELHKSHGLHVHLLTDSYLDVNAARSMAHKAGWGRIHVKRIPASKAGYLGKYLSKERPPCFQGWRLWAAFGKDWVPSKVKDIEVRNSFTRAYHHLKEKLEWDHDLNFFRRIDFVRNAIDFQILSGENQRMRGKPSELRLALLADGASVIY